MIDNLLHTKAFLDCPIAKFIEENESTFVGVDSSILSVYICDLAYPLLYLKLMFLKFSLCDPIITSFCRIKLLKCIPILQVLVKSNQKYPKLFLLNEISSMLAYLILAKILGILKCSKHNRLCRKNIIKL